MTITGPVVPGLLLTSYDRTSTMTQDFTKVTMTKCSMGKDQMNCHFHQNHKNFQRMKAEDESSELSQIRKVMRTEAEELGY